MKRALKAVLVLAILVALARYFPVVYYSSQFNDFVVQEVRRTNVTTKLKQALLQKAELYFLPVKPEDIQIKDRGGMLEVKVDYKVPVDFFVFQHELAFQAAGVGIGER